MKTKEIVIVLTNRGYVAIENNQIFDLWANKSLKVIYKELHQRYPNYKVHIGSMDRIEFQHAVEVSNQYLTNHEELKFIKSQNINLKINNKMKQITFNTETAKTLAKVATGFTTQKLAGVLHGTLQTGADVLQFGANAVAKGEATVLSKLKLYNESKEELFAMRLERTKTYQEMLKQTPKQILEASYMLKDTIENRLFNHQSKPINQ